MKFKPNTTAVQSLLLLFLIPIKTGADLRLVKPENIHVTIKFLGEVTPFMLNRIYEVMRNLSFQPFDIEIKGLGAFPSPNYPRIIWVGIEKGSSELTSIFNMLEHSLRRLGFRSERRGFSPHLTIARVKSGRKREALTHLLKELAKREFGIVRARCLRLKRSILAPQGPIYSTLKEICPEDCTSPTP
ncbi:TPA: RNA 2',3'-cyclic phosphodiesterase [Candidatus Bathyarchaeota archaeon]|nr:RNA 2',3'-cyclic phosphodiesterase [Candidatus Bathyarchaeota archaeon]